jgi:hypothetical protein
MKELALILRGIGSATSVGKNFGTMSIFILRQIYG